jgi:hypothetical protein
VAANTWDEERRVPEHSQWVLNAVLLAALATVLPQGGLRCCHNKVLDCLPSVCSRQPPSTAARVSTGSSATKQWLSAAARAAMPTCCHQTLCCSYPRQPARLPGPRAWRPPGHAESTGRPRRRQHPAACEYSMTLPSDAAAPDPTRVAQVVMYVARTTGPTQQQQQSKLTPGPY